MSMTPEGEKTLNLERDETPEQESGIENAIFELIEVVSSTTAEIRELVRKNAQMRCIIYQLDARIKKLERKNNGGKHPMPKMRGK